MNPYLYTFVNLFKKNKKYLDTGDSEKSKKRKPKPNLLKQKLHSKTFSTKSLKRKLLKNKLAKTLNPFRNPDNHIKLNKHEENPIIRPKEDSWWENWQTFNPGVVLLDDRVYLLYRAMGADGVSRLGYAVSEDGFHIDERLSYPVYEHIKQAKTNKFNYHKYHSGGGFAGAEDPRINKLDDEDTLYVTYTACEDGLRIGLTTISIEDFLKRNWTWTHPNLISKYGQTHKNWVVFPEKFNGKYAVLHNISRGIKIDYVNNLTNGETHDFNSPDPHNNPKLRKDCWDAYLRGVGAPPLKTKKGWLIFYHAMNGDDYSKYKIGAMLLDLKDPTKVLYRSKYPILEPNEYHHENNGCKPGIVYTNGAVIKDNTLLLYYGAADNYISVAYADIDDFIDALTHNKKPNLLLRILKKRKKPKTA